MEHHGEAGRAAGVRWRCWLVRCPGGRFPSAAAGAPAARLRCWCLAAAAAAAALLTLVVVVVVVTVVMVVPPSLRWLPSAILACHTLPPSAPARLPLCQVDDVNSLPTIPCAWLCILLVACCLLCSVPLQTWGRGYSGYSVPRMRLGDMKPPLIQQCELVGVPAGGVTSAVRGGGNAKWQGGPGGTRSRPGHKAARAPARQHLPSSASDPLMQACRLCTFCSGLE